MGGASDVPQNLHLAFEVEVAGYVSKIVSKSEVQCDQCSDESTDPAVVFCSTCRQFLCQLCHKHHKRHRLMSQHDIIDLDKDGAEKVRATMKPREQLCSVHNYEIEVFCENCKCAICTKCILDGHKDHGIVSLASVAKAQRDNMVGLLKTIEDMVTKLRGAISGHEEMLAQTEMSKMKACMSINAGFAIIHEELEKRRVKLLSAVDAMSETMTAPLTIQKEELEIIAANIGLYSEAASNILQTYTDHEVVAVGEVIATELRGNVKKVQTTSLTPIQNGDIFVSLQTENLVREVSNYGQVSDQYPSSPSSSTWASTSVAKVNTSYLVKVESKSSKGKRYTQGGVQVKGEMRPKVHNGAAAVSGEVMDHRDGTYTITLTPQTAGPHQLLITMDGQPLQNCPHDLDVRPKRDYLSLRNAQQEIKCMSSPYCIAIHDNRDIYVGSCDNCIYVFDEYGVQKNAIGKYGNGDGQFSYPYGIFIKGDTLFVADYKNNRVQLLTSRGEFIRKFGQHGVGQGQFNGPTAIVVDANNKLIVSDHNNHRIQIFNQNGGWLQIIDRKNMPGFLNPWGIALDPQGNIHIATHCSNAIQVFTNGGIYVRTYGNPKHPTGIAIDGNGYCVVSEYSGNCFSIYDPQGNKIHTVGNLLCPYGIILNLRSDSVYVATERTSTVLKYSL